MNKKEENPVGLAPPRRVSLGVVDNRALMPFPVQQGMADEERQVIELFQKERAVVLATAAINELGLGKIAEIHQYATETFDRTLSYILSPPEEPRGPEHEQYVQQFQHQQINLLADHLNKAGVIGATNIAVELHRPFYVAPQPPPPRSLWKRLFG